jgi:hypothetical protein
MDTVEVDKDTNSNNKKDHDKSSLKKIYICFTMLFIVSIGLCFYYIFDQIQNKAVWSITSDEKIEMESFFNKDCSEIMENLQNGVIKISEIQESMKKYSKTEHGKIFLDGIKVFTNLQNIVKYQKEQGFTELMETTPEFRKFFNYFGSNRSTKKEMLYPTFLASDIIVYIFNHRNIIDLHLEDKILTDKDEKCLSKYYQLAFSVFDYQKNLFNIYYEKSDFYQNTSTFDLLALALYSKAIVATKGKNDKYKINEILTTISENKFKIGGEKNRWYNWLEKDMKDVKEKTLTRLKISNRPPDVRGRWLI